MGVVNAEQGTTSYRKEKKGFRQNIPELPHQLYSSLRSRASIGFVKGHTRLRNISVIMSLVLNAPLVLFFFRALP